jgi:hypothetical protein
VGEPKIQLFMGSPCEWGSQKYSYSWVVPVSGGARREPRQGMLLLETAGQQVGRGCKYAKRAGRQKLQIMDRGEFEI